LIGGGSDQIDQRKVRKEITNHVILNKCHTR
jgi:hypothetical protein